jgi:hypothetical protein
VRIRTWPAPATVMACQTRPLLRRDARRVHKADRVSGLVPGLHKESSMNAPHPEFVRDEVIVCMLMAVCIGNAILGIIYSVMT